MQAALHQALAADYYSQFPFAPHINQRSRVIGRVGAQACTDTAFAIVLCFDLTYGGHLSTQP